MTTTPQKASDSSSAVSPNLTPVRFLDSPRSKSSSSDVVGTTVRPRLEVILKTLQDNFAKWQLAEKRGFALCNAIEVIKTRVLAAESSNKPASDEFTLYPKELRSYCEKLAVITSILKDITNNAEQSLRQLHSLAKLQGCAGEIFYRSWTITQFIDFVKLLMLKYQMESKVKHTVMKELPHSPNREELMRHSAAWEYPQYADESVTIMFKFLSEEINSKIK